MARQRRQRSSMTMRVRWLLRKRNLNLWWGRGDSCDWALIVRLMQADGLISRNTRQCDVNVREMIEAVRDVRDDGGYARPVTVGGVTG